MRKLNEQIKKMTDNIIPYMKKEAISITKEDLKKLNSWERKFLESIDRLVEMGNVLSEKQLEKLQQIDDKLCK